VAPYYLGDPGYGYDSGDNGDVETSQNASPEGYDEQEPPPPYPSYPSYPQPSAAAQAPAIPPANEEAVTVIFKDGRPAEQIRNFILTPGTLYVGGEHRREISVDQIDLVATARVNREAGVEFQLPAASR
jgi:redox-sensitive bicupin YhaK (pirin superfamily)